MAACSFTPPLGCPGALLPCTAAAVPAAHELSGSQVGPPGPDKAVIPGELHADPNKAARCCIDWAISSFGGATVWPGVADRPVPTVFELHGYQEDFLRRAAAAQGLPDAAAALQKLVGFAMKEEVVKAAIFDDGFNCVHCDSKSPPDWIQNNKGTKHPQLLALTPAALGFLGQEMLLEVGPPGPDKAVIPGELHADHLKAARCCIDWAIAEFGGELVWFQMHGYQHDFLGQMATMQVRGARTATACAVLGPWCWPCRQSAHSRGDVLCVWVQSLAGPAAALQKIVNLAMTDPVRPTALSMPASSTIAPPPAPPAVPPDIHVVTPLRLCAVLAARRRSRPPFLTRPSTASTATPRPRRTGSRPTRPCTPRAPWR